MARERTGCTGEWRRECAPLPLRNAMRRAAPHRLYQQLSFAVSSTTALRPRVSILLILLRLPAANELRRDSTFPFLLPA